MPEPTPTTVRALVHYHHMGDWSVARFLAEMLTEMKADNAIVDFEILASSRTEWMELGVYSVDLTDVVQQTMTWAEGKEAVEEYLTTLFRDEMLVQGLYGLETAEQMTTCEACGAKHVMGEDCPNYGNGPTHA